MLPLSLSLCFLFSFSLLLPFSSLPLTHSKLSTIFQNTHDLCEKRHQIVDARRESHNSQRTKTTNTTNNNHSISWHSSSIWIVTLYMYAPRIQIIYGNLEIFLHSIGVFFWFVQANDLLQWNQWFAYIPPLLPISPLEATFCLFYCEYKAYDLFPFLLQRNLWIVLNRSPIPQIRWFIFLFCVVCYQMYLLHMSIF